MVGPSLILVSTMGVLTAGIAHEINKPLTAILSNDYGALRFMKKGAVDFLVKPFDEEDLLKAVQEALKKDTVGLSAMDERRSILKRIKSLTPPRIRGFNLCDFWHAEQTVKAHRGRVMAKMKADSLAELVGMTGKVRIKSNPKSPRP